MWTAIVLHIMLLASVCDFCPVLACSLVSFVFIILIYQVTWSVFTGTEAALQKLMIVHSAWWCLV